MRNWRPLISLLLFWLGMMIPCPAQESVDLPEAVKTQEGPPPSGIRDNAGIFQREPALLADLTGRLQGLREQHGFEIYLVVESVLVSGSVQKMAAELQQVWIPKGNGVVLVYEADGRSLGFGRGYKDNSEIQASAGQVPSYEMMTILTNVKGTLDPAAMPVPFLEGIIHSLVTQFTAYFERKAEPAPEGRGLRLVLIIVGGAAALALIGLVVAWVHNRADQRASRRSFAFPEMEVTERLGAPYGGGEVSSRRFGAKPAERS